MTTEQASGTGPLPNAHTLAAVAHELNNPLAAIIGFAQLLLRHPPADLEQRAALETIHHEALRSASIVKELLVVARRREDQRRGRLNVNDVVQYVVRLRRYTLQASGVACALELDPTLPTVVGLRDQIEQLIINLLENAEHALIGWTARPKTLSPMIVVRTRAVDGDVVVEVEDNGPGIATDVADRVWDPFWTSKDDSRGTGLGLPIVNGIVASHRGTVCVERPESGGTRIVVTLRAETGADAPTKTPAHHALDILLVGDDQPDVDFLVRFLTSRGHAVVLARADDGAAKLATQMPFDVIVRVGADSAGDDAPNPQSPRVVCLARPLEIETVRNAIEAA